MFCFQLGYVKLYKDLAYELLARCVLVLLSLLISFCFICLFGDGFHVSINFF